MKALLTTFALALILVAPAQAWKSNEFVSPTGNIHCEYLTFSITCKQRQTKQQAVVSVGGRAFKVKGWAPPAVTYQHILTYGMSYEAHPFFCRSYTTQMVCGNRKTGHGFSIAREGVKVW